MPIHHHLTDYTSQHMRMSSSLFFHCLLLVSLFYVTLGVFPGGPGNPGGPSPPSDSCSCDWPQSCPYTEPSINFCTNIPPFNATLLNLVCSNPSCIDPVVDCYRANCSEERALFYQDVICSRNNQGELCWNLLESAVLQQSVNCQTCHNSLTCTSSCNDTLNGIMDSLGCCAGVYLNNTNIPVTLQIVPIEVITDCGTNIGEGCSIIQPSSSSKRIIQGSSTSVASSFLISSTPFPSVSPSRETTSSGAILTVGAMAQLILLVIGLIFT